MIITSSGEDGEGGGEEEEGRVEEGEEEVVEKDGRGRGGNNGLFLSRTLLENTPSTAARNITLMCKYKDLSLRQHFSLTFRTG